MKENDDFRRFNHRLTEKVYKEFMLYAIGRNINKYHRFLSSKLRKFKGKKKKISLNERWGLIRGEPLFSAAKNNDSPYK